MKSRDITGVTGVPELTLCYNCNKINFSEELSLSRTFKEIRDAGKWVMVSLHVFVEVPENNTKPEGTIFLLGE